jgi:hypothetical protein
LEGSVPSSFLIPRVFYFKEDTFTKSLRNYCHCGKLLLVSPMLLERCVCRVVIAPFGASAGISGHILAFYL